MSKKFKEKLCVYCAERPSTKTGDHVFAREFFMDSERNNPIKVPACVECNNEKSKIEHYLTSLLPFGGMHQDAKEHLVKLVPKRLDKNQKLKNNLQAGMQYIALTNELGESIRHLALPFDGDSYTGLFKYIAKALIWHHWGVFLSKDSFVYATALTEFGADMFHKYFFSLNPKNRIEHEIGVKTMKYLGVQAVDNDQITIWQFEVYNGLVTSSNAEDGFNKSSCIGVITGPRSHEQVVLQLFEP